MKRLDVLTESVDLPSTSYDNVIHLFQLKKTISAIAKGPFCYINAKEGTISLNGNTQCRYVYRKSRD